MKLVKTVFILCVLSEISAIKMIRDTKIGVLTDCPKSTYVYKRSFTLRCTFNDQETTYQYNLDLIIGNIEGVLKFGRRKFEETCVECSYESGKLACNCKRSDNTLLKTTIDLNAYFYINIYGKLKLN
jgi:hypothetical protein